MGSFNPFERFNLLKRETVNWIQLQSQYNNISHFYLLSDVPSITNWSVKSTLYDTTQIESIFS